MNHMEHFQLNLDECLDILGFGSPETRRIVGTSYIQTWRKTQDRRNCRLLDLLARDGACWRVLQLLLVSEDRPYSPPWFENNTIEQMNRAGMCAETISSDHPLYGQYDY